MARRKSEAKRRGLIPAALTCACAAALALGGAGMALAAVGDASPAAAFKSSFATFTPASLDPRLASLLGSGSGHSMRFTPAGAAAHVGRSITVAVRIDDETARAISVRSAIAAANDQLGPRTVEIAPSRFDLGLARGYQSFAQAKPVVAARIADIDMPDLAEYRPSEAPRGKPSRFSAHLALEKEQKTGREPRTYESLGNQTVDLGGAVRVMRNLDVTAGVRYSQDRDRIAPLTNGEQDSQAVYLGTQFHF